MSGCDSPEGSEPALVGTATDELRDVSPDLAELSSSLHARVLAEQVAEDPAAALERWLVSRAETSPVDLLGSAVFELAARTPGDRDSGISVHPPKVPTGDERRNPVRPRRCDDPPGPSARDHRPGSRPVTGNDPLQHNCVTVGRCGPTFAGTTGTPLTLLVTESRRKRSMTWFSTEALSTCEAEQVPTSSSASHRPDDTCSWWWPQPPTVRCIRSRCGP